MLFSSFSESLSYHDRAELSELLQLPTALSLQANKNENIFTEASLTLNARQSGPNKKVKLDSTLKGAEDR